MALLSKDSKYPSMKKTSVSQANIQLLRLPIATDNMDFSHLPSDYFVTSTQFTKTTYRDVYPAIDPESDPLNQKGRVVLITGASHGIGRHAIAKAFAKAAARAIILVGRDGAGLREAATELHDIDPDVEIRIEEVNICEQDSVKAMFDRIGKEYGVVHVLVNNAGSGESPLPLRDVDPAGFWYNFEVMVKGTFLITQQFLQLNGEEKKAIIITVASAAALNATPGLSSYSLSKLVQIQLQRFVTAENPNLTAVSLHPGIVMTRMTPPAFVPFAKDTFELVGGTAVWLASKQADFMNGRYFSVNWSVDEILQRKDEIMSQGLLQIGLQGKFGADQFIV